VPLRIGAPGCECAFVHHFTYIVIRDKAARVVTEAGCSHCDDNVGAREITKLLLEVEAVWFWKPPMGAKLWRQRASAPDMILIDFHMPIMDGLEGCLRQQHSFRDVPIVAITSGDDKVCREAVATGCNECLTKPLLLDGTKNLLTKYLGHLGSHRLAA
jgi:CheY-like chemotaxis protein